MEEPKQRLQRAREAAGFKSPTDAARALKLGRDLLISNENGNRTISRQAAEKYAKAFGVKAGWILYGENAEDFEEASPPQEIGLRRVTVTAHVQAGEWAESWEWEHDAKYPVMVPDLPELRSIRLYAAETRGPSMNKRYPERSVIVFSNVQETGEEPIPGKRYVVERKRIGGEAEHTVKLMHADAEGKLWLMPESDDPRYQAPISIEEGTGDGDEVAIIGRVVFSVTRE